MAKAFEDFETVDIGTLPSNLDLRGDIDASVEADQDASHGKALQLRRISGGNVPRAIKLLDASAPSATDEVIELVIRFRRSSATQQLLGDADFDGTNADNPGAVNIGANNVVGSIKTSTAFSYEHGLVTSNYQIARVRVSVNSDNNELMAKVFDAVANEPSEFDETNTHTRTPAGSSKHPGFGVSAATAGNSVWIDWYGWADTAADLPAPSSSDEGAVPVLSNATATTTGSSTADGSVDTDKSEGTLYWVVTQSETKPSSEQIQAGQNHEGNPAADAGNQSVTAAGTQNVNATGLDPGVTYWFHFQHVIPQE